MHLTLSRRVVILGPSTWKMHTIASLFMKITKLFWKEEYYQHIVLPNGYSPAVRVFTKVLTPSFKNLRSKGHLSVKYIDDSLLLGETFDLRPLICFINIRATVALLRRLGFTIHPENSVLVPTKQITFLGFVIDSVKMTITLTEERKQSMYTICQNILSNYQATIWGLAQTIGVIVSSFCSIWLNVLLQIGPWLDLVETLTRKLISQRKQQMN